MMNYSFFIARRYLRRSRKGYLFLTQVLALLSVAVGVAALILVLGVMNGFDRELRGKIIGVLPPVTVEVGADADDLQALEKKLLAVPGVTALAPFSETQAIIRSPAFLAGGSVRSVDLAREHAVTGIGRFILSGDGSHPAGGAFLPPHDGLLVGAELARRLRVGVGDRLELVTGFGMVPRSFPVTGIFRTGLYHFDVTLVLIPPELGRELFPGGGRPEAIGLGVADIYGAGQVARLVEKEFDGRLRVETWIDRNKALFSALELERRAMGVILALIVLVAGFNIASNLMMIVWRKSKEIGVLRSLGVTTGGIRAIFLWMGLLTGFWGATAGLALGLSLAVAGDRFQLIKLPGQFYGINHLPIRVAPWDVAWITALALVIALLAAVFPAQEAARVVPAVTLRTE